VPASILTFGAGVVFGMVYGSIFVLAVIVTTYAARFAKRALAKRTS
jgi:uncharacterized membrane protein YdjX (TVP38/TMEM64 family)